MSRKIVVEVIDGNNDELIGYAVCVVTSTLAGTQWHLLPEVYGVRSQAAHAAEAAR